MFYVESQACLQHMQCCTGVTVPHSIDRKVTYLHPNLQVCASVIKSMVNMVVVIVSPFCMSLLSHVFCWCADSIVVATGMACKMPKSLNFPFVTLDHKRVFIFPCHFCCGWLLCPNKTTNSWRRVP